MPAYIYNNKTYNDFKDVINDVKNARDIGVITWVSPKHAWVPCIRNINTGDRTYLRFLPLLARDKQGRKVNASHRKGMCFEEFSKFVTHKSCFGMAFVYFDHAMLRERREIVLSIGALNPHAVEHDWLWHLKTWSLTRLLQNLKLSLLPSYIVKRAREMVMHVLRTRLKIDRLVTPVIRVPGAHVDYRSLVRRTAKALLDNASKYRPHVHKRVPIHVAKRAGEKLRVVQTKGKTVFEMFNNYGPFLRTMKRTIQSKCK